MALPVVTVAAGGLPVIDAGALNMGMPVTEAANGLGTAVTKVSNGMGRPVRWATIMNDTPAFAPTTWNPADINAATLSLANLKVTATTNQGGVRAVKGQSTGKYYFEMSSNTFGSGSDAFGLATAAAALNMNVATGAFVGVDGFGIVRMNGTTPLGGGSLDGSITGVNCAVAVDLSAKLYWTKLAGGTWNGSASNNPATGIGGVSISALTFPLFPYVRLANGAGTAATMNFGATAFVGAVPATFTAGWG